MEEQKKNSKVFDVLAIISAASAIISCLVSLGLSVTNSIYSKYTLALALIFVKLSRIFLLIYKKEKDNFLFEMFVTVLLPVLAVFIGLSSLNIYFLIISFFIYSLLICHRKLIIIKKDHSLQSLIQNSLIIAFCFLYSFIFFFPAIYEKHATSMTNWNFIVLSYTIFVLIVSIKNALTPLSKKLKLDSIQNIIRKTLTEEILLGLLFTVTLFSVYFTLVEPNMVSFADSLWYSFSVVTTIGFGDVTVTTTLGRILSVILGMYGIVVVGLVTSIIVSIYNEQYKKRLDKQVKENSENK